MNDDTVIERCSSCHNRTGANAAVRVDEMVVLCVRCAQHLGVAHGDVSHARAVRASLTGRRSPEPTTV